MIVGVDCGGGSCSDASMGILAAFVVPVISYKHRSHTISAAGTNGNNPVWEVRRGSWKVQATIIIHVVAAPGTSLTNPVTQALNKMKRHRLPIL